MTFIEEKIKMTCEKLREWIVSSAKRIDNLSFVRCGYKTTNIPPDEGWEPLFNGEPIKFSRDSHAWIRFTADVPATASSESVFLRMTTGKEGQWDAENPQCTIFIDGESAVQAFDTNHTELLLSPGKKEILIYFYAGMFDCILYPSVSLVVKNNDVNRLYYDMAVPLAAVKCLNKNSYEYTAILNCLDKAALLLDFRSMRGREFFESVAAAQAYLQDEFYGKVCGKDARGEIALIGHTHIDVAWKWTLAQTNEKAQRSFSTVIQLMKQYPDYVFMSSQPQLYAYVKQNDPALYEQIRQRIKDGRWEPEGAMWLEADTNLVSGESLIRQILYGKKFMKEEFGCDNHVLWLPDVFGYSAALPQILKKCGVDTFFTTKISWCETDKFPHDNFIWQGIDGSEVFAVLSDGYVKRLEPGMIMDSQNKHVDKKYSQTHIATFGFGDGGGGPTAEMLENYERLKAGLPGFPRVTMKKSADILAEIRAQFDKNTAELRFVPKWVGELYLEMHRGTYTTMAANKKNNRVCEFLYQKAETAAGTALLLAGAPYPAEKLDKGWHTILKNQFHDIIPGSSIHEVYEDSDAEYAALLHDGNEMFESAVRALAAGIGSEGGVFVYNPTPFEAGGLITLNGKEVCVPEIPAHGYAVVTPEESADGSLYADEHTVENRFVKVCFDEKYHIVSFYDKRFDRELIPDGECANVLEVFEDYPRSYDAWEITEYYKQKKWVADDVAAVSVIRDTFRVGISVERKYRNSVIRQAITLTQDSARLDFKTEIDWQEDHVLLKAAFPLALRATHANYEIQFGHIERPTHRNTSWDQAKFEVCAHKWADLSEADYGAALLNDCKYGYSCEENVLKLSLLKAPTYPNPTADRGHHSFTYALYPHSGPVSLSDTVKQAYLLNNPLCAFEISPAQGSLPDRFGFVSTDTPSAVVDTVKRAEDGNGYIVRLYDAANRKATVTLRFGFAIQRAVLTDMLENDMQTLEVSDNAVTLPLSNFEVLTLRIIPKA